MVDIDRSVASLMSKYNDNGDIEAHLDELTQANSDLLNSNELLRKELEEKTE